ncbi:hypothetical protein RvY_16183 [Ramazzottius varieornatus]|uniref:non-specific serine/threonine protein kinase n=1 Tax=Ramazzottius varieornatus TaxID=947166 RepID=A0A1D1VXJ9_RAMVA|nr:hypothetical protein RvY_16183 [Ramazzottius varieornatus]
MQAYSHANHVSFEGDTADQTTSGHFTATSSTDEDPYSPLNPNWHPQGRTSHQWPLSQPKLTTAEMMEARHSSLSKEFRDWEKSSLRGLTVAGSYTCGAVIGRGSFGTIRIGQLSQQIADRRPHGSKALDHVAIKLEKLNKYGTSPCLDREYKLLRKLQRNSGGFPNILALANLGPYRALVMQLLGPNLQELFERCGKKFSIPCIAMIALQLMDRFEVLHSERILYRDVKGENFLIGFPGSRTQNVIHVVDLGLAREWTPDPYERRSPAGTPRYMSLRTHMGKQPSYRDDLESLSLLFIYFAKGKLPWQGIHDGSTIDRIKRIGIKKGSISPEDLCQDLPDAFCRSLKASRQLAYDQLPNYNLFRSLFQKVLNETTDSSSGMASPFDWLQKNVNLDFGYDKKEREKKQARLKNDIAQGRLQLQPVQSPDRKADGRGDYVDTPRGEVTMTPPTSRIPSGAFSVSKHNERSDVVPPSVQSRGKGEVGKVEPSASAPLDQGKDKPPAKSSRSWGCLAFVKSLMSHTDRSDISLA